MTPDGEIVTIPIVENDENDFALASALLESEPSWLDICRPVPWLKRYRVETEWIGEAEVADNPGGRIDAVQALLRILELGSPAVLIDIGLSRDEEAVAQDLGERYDQAADMEEFWGSDRIKRLGGFWLLKELRRLREIGFTIPAVGIYTGFQRFARTEMPWTDFLLDRGATWVFRKPFDEETAERVLRAVATCLCCSAGGQLSTRLAGIFYRYVLAPDSRLWEASQVELFSLLAKALERDGFSNQRDLAGRLGVAHGTFRNWLEKTKEVEP